MALWAGSPHAGTGMGTVTRAIEELRSRGIGGIVCAAGERINEDLSRELFLLFVNPHLYGLVCHFAEGRRVYDENGNGALNNRAHARASNSRHRQDAFPNTGRPKPLTSTSPMHVRTEQISHDRINRANQCYASPHSEQLSGLVLQRYILRIGLRRVNTLKAFSPFLSYH